MMLWRCPPPHIGGGGFFLPGFRPASRRDAPVVLSALGHSFFVVNLLLCAIGGQSALPWLNFGESQVIVIHTFTPFQAVRRGQVLRGACNPAADHNAKEGVTC